MKISDRDSGLRIVFRFPSTSCYHIWCSSQCIRTTVEHVVAHKYCIQQMQVICRKYIVDENMNSDSHRQRVILKFNNMK